MTVANVNVTKVLHKRGNTVQNNNYTGVAGEITIDTQAKTLRIHDGVTVGGNIITATLTGNAGSQQTAIDSLNSNVGAYQIYANANASTQTININSKANISGATFSGNVTVPYLLANNQVHIDDHLLVGPNHNQGVPFLNPAALFFGNTYSSASNKYYQLVLQNSDPNGSGDIVVTADDGNDSSNYITVGVNGSTYSDPSFPAGPGNNPHDGYLYMAGGNLVITGGSDLFVASGIAANLHLIGGGSNTIITSDNTNGSWNISGNLSVLGNVTSDYMLVTGGLISTGASPAPIISGFSSISTTGSTGNIRASGNLVASQGAYITGNLMVYGNATMSNIAYTPTTSSDWSAPAPTTFGQAVDRLAALVKTLNGGTGA